MLNRLILAMTLTGVLQVIVSISEPSAASQVINQVASLVSTETKH
jgi:hypothetical protein